MGLIYYKGELYTDIPLILANSILLTEEEAERYNIVINDSDVEEVLMDKGERLYLGDPLNVFIASGVQVVMDTDPSSSTLTVDMLPNLTPSHLYTAIPAIPNARFYRSIWRNFPAITISLQYAGNTWSLKPEDGIASSTAWDIGSTAPAAFGLFLRFRSINATSLKVMCDLCAAYFLKNQSGEYVLTDIKRAILGSNHGGNVELPISEVEYQYMMGIKGKYSYVTEEEWEELIPHEDS